MHARFPQGARALPAGCKERFPQGTPFFAEIVLTSGRAAPGLRRSDYWAPGAVARFLRAPPTRVGFPILMKQRRELNKNFLSDFDKIKFLLIQWFSPLFCATSPVAGFRFRVTSSEFLISESSDSLFFFCFLKVSAS